MCTTEFIETQIKISAYTQLYQFLLMHRAARLGSEVKLWLGRAFQWTVPILGTTEYKKYSNRLLSSKIMKKHHLSIIEVLYIICYIQNLLSNMVTVYEFILMKNDFYNSLNDPIIHSKTAVEENIINE